MAKRAKPSSKGPLSTPDTGTSADGSARSAVWQPEALISRFKSQPVECGLYVVATPIGNLMDITLRALDVLAQADLVVCEDTRVTGKLLSHFGLRVPMTAYTDHSAATVRPKILAALAEGKAVVLVSDAGTPLISDPGYKLVEACLAENIRVIPVPGASALLSALVSAGLPTDRVLFAGFLPAKAKARRDTIAGLASVDATLVTFETGPRLAAALADMAAALGPRPAAVTRELTKLHEEIRRGTLATLAAAFAEGGAPKGELVIVTGPPQEVDAPTAGDLDAALRTAMETMSVRDAAAAVAAASGAAKRDVYARALALKADGAD